MSILLKITPPNLTDYQKELLYCPEPNTFCEASTKVGKTFSHMWWLWEKSHQPPKAGAHYWWTAPVYKQAEIAFERLKRPIRNIRQYKVNNSDLTITTPVDSIIEFKSCEKPDNLYGEDVYAVVMDEISRMRQEAWYAIRSTLTATRGPVKMIGNVKGIGHWTYNFARDIENKKLDNWRYFKLTCEHAVKAGILDQAEVDKAKNELPYGIFLELYYGIPFVNSSNKFAYAFDKSKHVRKTAVNYDYPIYLSFDFNKNPISCVVAQIINNAVHIPFSIKLANSDIYKLCEYIKTKFSVPGKPDPEFIINGDASGNAGSAMVKDNLNYFRIIKAELDLSMGQMQQLASNPKIEENQVLVNAALEHVEHFIDPDGAQGLIFDLEFAEMLPDGKLKKADREDPTQQLDALDGYRYLLNRNFRHMLKGYRNQ
jgi:hypothetical protein